MSGPWRKPPEETVDLYPGLTVCDNRVSGSITVDRSRLPLWAFITTAIHGDWTRVEDGWSPTENYGFTADDLSRFLHCLLEQRGEFGRLLLVLADAERCEQKRGGWEKSWWQTKRHRKRVGDQLRRCMAVLEAEDDR